MKEWRIALTIALCIVFSTSLASAQFKFERPITIIVPWAVGGAIGAQFLKTAYTFRRFTPNYLLSLHHSFKCEDGKLALDVVARSLAYVVLLAGVPATRSSTISWMSWRNSSGNLSARR